MKTDHVLEICNVTKHYGKKCALSDFSFVFKPGIYGLLGPNGAGKSTLMYLITDNLLPDKNGGIIKWDNENIQKLGKKYRTNVGYMPQQQNLYPTMTAYQFMGYISALKGIAKSKAASEIENLLDTVELKDVADKKIGGFSGGMKQRLLFASCLLGNPSLVILDEPTAGLDPRQRVILREKIEEYGKNRIIIIATHITSDIETIADCIVMMKNGKIIDNGSVEELVKKVECNPKTLENLYMQYYDEEAKKNVLG